MLLTYFRVVFTGKFIVKLLIKSFDLYASDKGTCAGISQFAHLHILSFKHTGLKFKCYFPQCCLDGPQGKLAEGKQAELSVNNCT